MANLVVVKNGEFWEIFNVDGGVTILSLTNQALANNFAAAGVDTVEARQLAVRQDVNYQGGVQAQSTTSTSNTAGNPTATNNTVVPVAEIQTTATTSNDTGTPVATTTVVPASSINTDSATSGLTPAQLSVLGGADPTDPFIRARLDLPPLGGPGTLQPNLVDAISNNLPSLSNTFLSLNSIQTSIGNTFVNIGNLFSGVSSTSTFVPVAEVQTQSNTTTNIPVETTDPVPVSEVQTAQSTTTDQPLVIDTSTPVNEIQLDAATPAEAYYQQFVQAFSESQVQTTPSPFEPVATIGDTPLVPIVTVDEVPDTSVQFGADQVDPEVVPSITTDPVPDTEVQFTADGVDPEVVPSITTDPVPDTEVQFTADSVDPVADPEATAPADPVPDTEVQFTTDEVSPEIDPEVYVTFDPATDLVPASEIDTGPDPMSIDDESSWGTVTPEQQANADEINGVPQQPATNDWQAEVAQTRADNAASAASARASSTGSAESTASQDASVTQGFLDQARQQQTISNQRKQVNNGDWRVKLRLAPMAKYLYNADDPGILQPLKTSNGVIFPYTPSISTSYKAQYSDYSLTHSNYKGYFYQGSYVDAISINGTFTAQNTVEANYLLAVITFFKSVTKMFYGQDAQRGAPPPLTYLSGLGEYQFNEHPCLVQQFNYTLPADVDYIRANSTLNVGLNLINQRSRQTVATASNFGGLNRLAAAALTKGAISKPPPPPTLGINTPTYVPTKMEIQLTLLPVQSRQQVSTQFSLKSFANGDLIKGGFW